MQLEPIELRSAHLEYSDSGGDGPPVVLLHGLLMNVSLWEHVVPRLEPDYRCIVPNLPMGGHNVPLNADADISASSITGMVAELIEALGIEGCMVVGNDTGGAIAQLLMTERPDLVGSVALVACEAFDNYPPGLTGKTVVAAGKLPVALFGPFMQQMRIKALRRLPIAFGWLTKNGDKTTRRWMNTLLSDRGIRRDAVKFLRSISKDKGLLVENAERLATFTGPALVVWANGDRVMPPAHGRMLAELIPNATLVEIFDTYSLIPLDQPLALSDELRTFAAHAHMQQQEAVVGVS